MEKKVDLNEIFTKEDDRLLKSFQECKMLGYTVRRTNASGKDNKVEIIGPKNKEKVKLEKNIKKSYKEKKDQASNLEMDVYHDPKLLLSLYRDVVWRVKRVLYEIDTTAESYGYKTISELLDLLNLDLSEPDLIDAKTLTETQLTNTIENVRIIEIIDKAVLHLKSYPDNGEIYHQIILYCYINEKKLCDGSILRKLNLTQSTFYRYKTQALEVLRSLLWGFDISPLSDFSRPLKSRY